MHVVLDNWLLMLSQLSDQELEQFITIQQMRLASTNDQLDRLITEQVRRKLAL